MTAQGNAWIGYLLAVAMLAFPPLRATDAQNWPDEHTDPPFHYHADFQLQPIHPVLKSVTDLQHEIPQLLGVQALDEPVHVFLFQREGTYRSYVREYFPTVPNRPALFIKQRGPGMVFAHVSPKLAEDLRHETAHAVLHGILPMVPLWLDEGLGEYFEVTADQRATGHAHLQEIQKVVRQRRVPRLSSLEQLTDLSAMKAEHYRNAWSWVHFLLHYSPKSHGVLIAYLRDIEASSPPGKLSVRLRREIPHLEQAYLRHFSQHAPPVVGQQRFRDRFRIGDLFGN